MPHIGWPQSEPETRARSVKTAPTGEAASAATSASGWRQISAAAEASPTQAYANMAIQAAGTWMYMIRTVSPC